MATDTHTQGVMATINKRQPYRCGISYTRLGYAQFVNMHISIFYPTDAVGKEGIIFRYVDFMFSVAY